VLGTNGGTIPMKHGGRLLCTICLQSVLINKKYTELQIILISFTLDSTKVNHFQHTIKLRTKS
jgi:hypothetical protein